MENAINCADVLLIQSDCNRKSGDFPQIKMIWPTSALELYDNNEENQRENGETP